MSQPPIISGVAVLGSEPSANEGSGNSPTHLADKLGVIRIVTETYAVGEFRYTSLTDAIAQAQRSAKA